MNPTIPAPNKPQDTELAVIGRPAPTAKEAARAFLARGWMPLPVQHRGKRPFDILTGQGLKGWSNVRITSDNLPRYFGNGERMVMNVGVALGPRSHGLVDVDLDDKIAVNLAPRFLPPTKAIFGRESRPRSHYLYVASNILDESSRGRLDLGKLELRGAGHQTVFPPSTHPDGDRVRWDHDGEPALVDPSVLTANVYRLAGGVRIAKQWPAQGDRDTAAMALAGGLARLPGAAYTPERIVDLVEAIAAAAGDEESEKRGRTAKATLERFAAGDQAITGFPRLAELLGQAVVAKTRLWLNGNRKIPAEPVPKIVTPRAVPPWVPFPTDQLPEPVRSFVTNAAISLHGDTAYVGLPTLSMLAAAIGTTARLSLKKTWLVWPILWTCTIAKSGQGKSPATSLVFKYPCAREHTAAEQHRFDMDEHTTAQARDEVAVKVWRSKGCKEDRPVVTPKPIQKRYIVGDCTLEALAPILAENPRGVLNARDESGAWFGSFRRYQARGGDGDLGCWLSMHKGEPAIIDRKTNRERIVIPAAAVSITGGITPGTLERLCTEEYREAGLLARFLVAHPPVIEPKWTEYDLPDSDDAAMRTLYADLCGIRHRPTADGGLQPHGLELTPDAKALWIEWVNETGARAAAEEGHWVAFLSKAREVPARLAIVFHLIEHRTPDPCRIADHTMAAAIEVTRWFVGEGKRVYVRLDQTDEERKTAQLMELIARRGGEISTREWQRVRHRHRTSEAARAELNGFVDAGLGTWVHLPQEGPGRPKQVFRLSTDESQNEISK